MLNPSKSSASVNTEVNLNPHTYNTPETDVSSTYPLSLSRAGGCGGWRAEGTIWSNPSTGGTQASVRRGTLLTVATAMFSQSKKKGY